MTCDLDSRWEKSAAPYFISNQVSGTNDHVWFSDDLLLYIEYLNSLTTPLLSQSHYIQLYQTYVGLSIYQ